LVKRGDTLSLEHRKKLSEGLTKWNLNRKGYKRKRKATLRMIKALQYMNQGLSHHKAKLKAGYSLGEAIKPKRIFLQRKGVQQMIADMGEELVNQGLTTQYMTIKFKQWLEATNEKGSPDNRVQMEAYREWKKVMDEQSETENGLKVKRKLTIEEFVTGETKQKEDGIDA
jgi:hypothetical protein